jgi:predicted transcriptional regulator
MAKVTSVRLSDELVARLDQLAACLDRPRAWVIEQALVRYVDDEAWQVQAVADALAAYQQSGASVRPHSEVMQRLKARIRAQADDASPLA